MPALRPFLASPHRCGNVGFEAERPIQENWITRMGQADLREGSSGSRLEP